MTRQKVREASKKQALKNCLWKVLPPRLGPRGDQQEDGSQAWPLRLASVLGWAKGVKKNYCYQLPSRVTLKSKNKDPPGHKTSLQPRMTATHGGEAAPQEEHVTN